LAASAVRRREPIGLEVSIAGFRAQNHPQQTGARGARISVDDRQTPPELFDPLNERFGFTIDVAASSTNTRCQRYFTKEDDGLRQSWTGERVWCNPPYSDIGPWVEKAWAEWTTGEVGCIVMLVPANRTEQVWWQKWVEPVRDAPDVDLHVEFLPGRQRFIAPGDFVDMFGRPRGGDIRPPFGCCLLIWSTPSQ